MAAKIEKNEFQDALGELLEPVQKPDKDLMKLLATRQVSKDEIRMLVDSFYQTQDDRKRISNQIRAIQQNTDESLDTELLQYHLNQKITEEESIKKILTAVSCMSNTGKWLNQVMGIGPVLSCGLMAYFDVTGKNSAGSFHSYAGLNDNNSPKIGKEKSAAIVAAAIENNGGVLNRHTVYQISQVTGRKMETLMSKSATPAGKISKTELCKAISYIPYNQKLKNLCWKCGHQFVYLKNNPKSLYGSLIKSRIEEEVDNNEAGRYKAQADLMLGNEYNFSDIYVPYEGSDDEEFYKAMTSLIKSKTYGKSTEAYKAMSQGKLSDGHIAARALRYATKIFISHLFEQMYIDEHKEMPPKPYVIAHMGHKDYIAPEVPYIY